MLSVGYVARRGLHQQREANINQPTIATVLANPGVNLDALRPYKGYNSIRESDNIGRSLYNSLQISFNKRFSRGLTYGIAYTLSKTMDDGSAQRDIIPNTYDASNMWGQSDYDIRHIFIANYMYELPFFRNQTNFAGKALGGWQLSGIVQAQTGSLRASRSARTTPASGRTAACRAAASSGLTARFRTSSARLR